MTHPLLPRLRQARVVPVIRTASTEHARQVVQWLHSAGLRIFEITMSVPGCPRPHQRTRRRPVSAHRRRHRA